MASLCISVKGRLGDQGQEQRVGSNLWALPHLIVTRVVAIFAFYFDFGVCIKSLFFICSNSLHRKGLPSQYSLLFETLTILHKLNSRAMCCG